MPTHQKKLSSRLKNEPWIRALGMRVYPHSPQSMVVVGGSVPHEVFAFKNKLKCDCTAAKFGSFCAHVAAVEYLYQSEQQGADLKKMFNLDRSSREKRYPVSLPRPQKQLYAGLFSGWFMSDGKYGQSIVVKCLVTHSVAGGGWTALEKITEARAYLGIKWWYNLKKQESSHPIAFLSAVTGMEPQQVEAMETDDAMELFNESVGNGILFSAYVEKTEDNSERNYMDKDSFDCSDEEFNRLAEKMAPKLQFTEGDDGRRYISKPQPTFKEPEKEDRPAASSAPVEDDDEIPF